MTYPLLACLATEVFAPPTIPSGSSWVIQQKVDGHRVIIDYRTSLPRTLNRNGRTYSAGPFRLSIPDVMKGYVLDGEYDPKNRRYHIFDVLKHPGDADLQYDRVLEQRYDLAAALHFDLIHAGLSEQWNLVNQHLARSEQTMMLWTGYYHGRALAPDNFTPIDGVIYKRGGSTYSPGRGTDAWLKFKFTSDISCIVTGLNIDGKSNCSLGLWDPLSESMFDVGKASTAGKRVTINSVVEVRFLKFTGKRLREPRIVQVRDDVLPSECEISQLIPFVPHLNED